MNETMTFRAYQQLTKQQQDELFDEEILDLIEIVSGHAEQAAIASTSDLPAYSECIFSNPIPDAFGKKWANHFSNVRNSLTNEYRAATKELAIISTRLFEYADISESIILHEMGVSADSGGPDIETPIESKAEEDGWAEFALKTVSAPIKPKELLHDLSFSEYPPSESMLMMYALMWFYEAAEVHKAHPEGGMNLLYEAERALLEAYNSLMWEAGKAFEIENRGASKTVSENAKNAAAARHQENHANKQYIIDWYKENRGKFKTVDAAATEAVKQAPIKLRTAQEYIRQARKEIRSACTA